MNPLSSERSEYDLYVNENFQILYEDEWMLAVEKPAPLPVHSVGRFRERNLISLLKKNGYGERCAAVNRLDSETSGVILISKNSETAGKLGIQFESRRVIKEYQAIVLGNFQVAEGMIETPLGFEESRGFRYRIADPFGESAKTGFEVLEQKPSYALIRIFPQTGRLHQIRAHFALIGHPLVGDKLYIDPDIFESYIQNGWQERMRSIVKFPRLALHAGYLKIRHPQFGDELEFTSEFPVALKDFWQDLP